MKPLIATAFALALCVTDAMAADVVSGTATLNAEKAALSLGVGTWKPESRVVSLGLFVGPVAGASDRAHLVVDLTFKEGTTVASPAALDSCHISFSEFKDSPFDFNGFADQCGVTTLSGDLKVGGTVTAALKGTTDFKMTGMTSKTMTWDFKATSTLRTAEFAADIAVAVGPQAASLGAGGGEPGQALVKEKCRTGVSGPLAVLAMQNCKVLSGRVDGAMAVLAVEADTMGTRMRNDFVLAKEAGAWTVKKEGAWRSVQ